MAGMAHGNPAKVVLASDGIASTGVLVGAIAVALATAVARPLSCAVKVGKDGTVGGMGVEVGVIPAIGIKVGANVGVDWLATLGVADWMGLDD